MMSATKKSAPGRIILKLEADIDLSRPTDKVASLARRSNLPTTTWWLVCGASARPQRLVSSILHFSTMGQNQSTGAPKPLLPVQLPVPEDIVIAQAIQPVHISKIASKLGLRSDEYDLYGQHKAKVRAGLNCTDRSRPVGWPNRNLQPLTPRLAAAPQVKLSVRDRLKDAPSGNYVVVAGITPTPLGEGKSTTTVGLCQVSAPSSNSTLGLQPPCKPL